MKCFHFNDCVRNILCYCTETDYSCFTLAIGQNLHQREVHWLKNSLHLPLTTKTTFIIPAILNYGILAKATLANFIAQLRDSNQQPYDW